MTPDVSRRAFRDVSPGQTSIEDLRGYCLLYKKNIAKERSQGAAEGGGGKENWGQNKVGGAVSQTVKHNTNKKLLKIKVKKRRGKGRNSKKITFSSMTGIASAKTTTRGTISSGKEGTERRTRTPEGLDGDRRVFRRGKAPSKEGPLLPRLQGGVGGRKSTRDL